MWRLPVRSGTVIKTPWIRTNTSSSSIRRTFIEYFVENHSHKHVKSSPVVPLCDPSVPFVNAGMNQFKGVFQGQVEPPCPRAVNSQKCIRVGGKHNDLDVVGTDGTHHTFFEMLGNWSFGDYYKKEACQMAWDLLLGPYRLKPENLMVTYFSGDAVMGIQEDRQCRDIWKAIGVPSNRILGMGASDNFWEMGPSGPCGPCSEIHYVHPDGTLTEIWNIVFIQCNREADGAISPLSRQHVDTGMGLERAAALLQRVRSNYDTDLFQPLLNTIHRLSKVEPYGGQFGTAHLLDAAYRRLADHARMVSVCLADGVFPATSLNLKQIMRKSFKISAEVFQNRSLLSHLYDEVATSLGDAYPELHTGAGAAKLIIEHELNAYEKMKAGMQKKWKGLVGRYPEVEELADVELPGFVQGYKDLKEAMAKQNSTVIPGELVFKLYDSHGLQEDVIQRVADLNRYTIDKEGFTKLLAHHRSRHKTAIKEQSSNKGELFHKAIDQLRKTGFQRTDDSYKYKYSYSDDEIIFKPLTSNLIAILNEDCEWIDYLDPCENRPYYLVTQETNFYCEEGGQAADTGRVLVKDGVALNVDAVFKIRNFVFHKGRFSLDPSVRKRYVRCYTNVSLELDGDRRLKIMRNHTATHLLNAAVRKVLPDSVVCQLGSGVSDRGLRLQLAVYGDKLTQDVLLKAQDLVRESIRCDAALGVSVTDGARAAALGALAVPGEAYPETGLRVCSVQPPLLSKELCCGTHVPSTAHIGDFCVTTVKGAGGHSPVIHAITGDAATQARELFCRAMKLEEIIELMEPARREAEVADMRRALTAACGAGGALAGEAAQCAARLDALAAGAGPRDVNDQALQSIAEAEVQAAVSAAQGGGRRFVVQFLRCSYLMAGGAAARVLSAAAPALPAVLIACAGGELHAACHVPPEFGAQLSAPSWLRGVAAALRTRVLPGARPHYAEIAVTKVSLIECEQLVQDAMRAAIEHAQTAQARADTPHAQDRQRS